MPAHRTPDNCTECGVALTEANWRPTERKGSRKLCAEHARAYFLTIQRARQKDQPEYYRAASRATVQKLRVEVLDHYGNRCACCSDEHQEFLTIDHVGGGGAEHRRAVQGGSTGIYRWVRDHGFPDGFQLLCWNCNKAKYIYGQCPHQRLKLVKKQES